MGEIVRVGFELLWTDTDLVHLCLIFKLRVFGLDRFKFDGDLLSGDDVDAEIDVSKGPTPNLLADAVFASDSEVHGWAGLGWSGQGKVYYGRARDVRML